MSTIAPCRSLLFSPASEPAWLRKAVASGADAVIVDLEDGVGPALKAEARANATDLFADGPLDGVWLVRINGAETEHFTEDLTVASRLPIAGVVLPKATPDALRAVADVALPLVDLIETAEGLARAEAVAACGRVARLQLGAADLAVELGIESRADGLELLHPRAAVVLASALGGCAPPIDSVHLALRDLDGLELESRLARSLGFGGKACIHPSHVAVINRIFSPSAEELERAERIVEAYERALADGRGAVAVEGAMVDRPVIAWAQRTPSGRCPRLTKCKQPTNGTAGSSRTWR